jgi:hypothetical protein
MLRWQGDVFIDNSPRLKNKYFLRSLHIFRKTVVLHKRYFGKFRYLPTGINRNENKTMLLYRKEITMKRKTMVFFGIVLLCSIQVQADKLSDIKKLMKVTGSLEIGAQFASAIGEQMTAVVKSANPAIEDTVIKIMNEELQVLVEEAMNEKGGLAEELYKIYDKYYTHDEIKELLKFYNTPVGKKTIKVLPQLMQESMQAGQKWGQSMGPAIVEKLKVRMKSKGVPLPSI